VISDVLQSLSMTNFPLRTSSHSSCKIDLWCSTFQMNIPREECRIVNTPSMYFIHFSLNTCKELYPMLRFRETLVQKSLTMRKRFVYLKNGKSSWNQSLSSRRVVETQFTFWSRKRSRWQNAPLGKSIVCSSILNTKKLCKLHKWVKSRPSYLCRLFQKTCNLGLNFLSLKSSSKSTKTILDDKRKDQNEELLRIEVQEASWQIWFDRYSC